MGIFDKCKKKESDTWKNAYQSKPKFYQGRNGKPFGAFALTEGTLTSLPTNPKAIYQLEHAEVQEWKLVLVSTTNQGALGDIDYDTALQKLMPFAIGEKDDSILVKALSLEEISSILQ